MAYPKLNACVPVILKRKRRRRPSAKPSFLFSRYNSGVRILLCLCVFVCDVDRNAAGTLRRKTGGKRDNEKTYFAGEGPEREKPICSLAIVQGDLSPITILYIMDKKNVACIQSAVLYGNFVINFFFFFYEKQCGEFSVSRIGRAEFIYLPFYYVRAAKFCTLRYILRMENLCKKIKLTLHNVETIINSGFFVFVSYL